MAGGRLSVRKASQDIRWELSSLKFPVALLIGIMTIPCGRMNLSVFTCFLACCIKFSQMGAAARPPLSPEPKDFIRSNPTQTPVTRWGV